MVLFNYLAAHILCVRMKVIRMVEIEKTADVKRPYIKQLLQKKLRFPLPHRHAKTRGLFSGIRPSTF